jgi:hypothetical protein
MQKMEESLYTKRRDKIRFNMNLKATYKLKGQSMHQECLIMVSYDGAKLWLPKVIVPMPDVFSVKEMSVSVLRLRALSFIPKKPVMIIIRSFVRP